MSIETEIYNLTLLRPLHSYSRLSNVEEELRSLTEIGPQAREARLTGTQSTTLQLETLVAALRAYVRCGDEVRARQVLVRVTERIVSRTQRHLDTWGIYGRDEREDIAREILVSVIECILSVEERQEFWECRFWTCFDRRARTILRDAADRLQAVSIDIDGGMSCRSRASGPSVEEKSLVATALTAMPEPLRTAFVLKHYGAYKEESADPTEQTIASILSVTGRTVRNYLQRANRILEDWRDPSEEPAKNDTPNNR